jgi:hypothetical protein
MKQMSKIDVTDEQLRTKAALTTRQTAREPQEDQHRAMRRSTLQVCAGAVAIFGLLAAPRYEILGGDGSLIPFALHLTLAAVLGLIVREWLIGRLGARLDERAATEPHAEARIFVPGAARRTPEIAYRMADATEPHVVHGPALKPVAWQRPAPCDN